MINGSMAVIYPGQQGAQNPAPQEAKSLNVMVSYHMPSDRSASEFHLVVASLIF
jgi:hypothetical protein